MTKVNQNISIDITGALTLIALAPLTNVALALRLDPKFGRKLKDLAVMGGNIEGNNTR